MPANDNEAVTSSCGCVFCDLELDPEMAGDERVHVLPECDQYGRIRYVPCTRPVTSVVPFLEGEPL